MRVRCVTMFGGLLSLSAVMIAGCATGAKSETSDTADVSSAPSGDTEVATMVDPTAPATVAEQETIFVRIGGEERLRALSNAFYDHMEQDPEFAAIRAMHPEDLDDIRVKLADFMCGWFGGPNYYLRKHGPPRLPRRHRPFPIGSADRDEWVACMALALDDLEIEGELRAELDDLFYRGADFVRNRD